MEEALKEQMKACWAEVLDCESVADDADFFDLGGTSMEAVFLAALVQERLGLALDAVEIVLNPELPQLLLLLDGRRHADGQVHIVEGK